MIHNLSPLAPFGAEVSGVSLQALNDDGLRALLRELYENRFLVIRTGGMSRREFVTFALRIGEPIGRNFDKEHPEIIPITNVGVDTKAEAKGAAHWHTDQSFTEQRSSVTMLYSEQAPRVGGETRFANLADAYDALDSSMKETIADLVVEHRHGVSISARPGDHVPIPPKGWDQSYTVRHPLVRKHPVSGRKTLYAISGTPQGIVGMPLAEAAVLLEALCQHSFRAPFITEHHHVVDDLVMWDNPTTMHSATPIGAATGPEDTRVIRRISLRGACPLFTEDRSDGT